MAFEFECGTCKYCCHVISTGKHYCIALPPVLLDRSIKGGAGRRLKSAYPRVLTIIPACCHYNVGTPIEVTLESDIEVTTS